MCIKYPWPLFHRLLVFAITTRNAFSSDYLLSRHILPFVPILSPQILLNSFLTISLRPRLATNSKSNQRGYTLKPLV